MLALCVGYFHTSHPDGNFCRVFFRSVQRKKMCYTEEKEGEGLRMEKIRSLLASIRQESGLGIVTLMNTERNHLRYDIPKKILDLLTKG